MPELPSSSHLEGQENRESQTKEAERYLRLAEKHPEQLSQELKKNPELSTLLQKILGKEQYETLGQTFPKEENSDIVKLQGEIYGFVDINPDIERNSIQKKFLKGIIDALVIENAELAKAIIESKGVILRDMVAQIFTWEGLKQVAHGLRQSMMGLFSGDAYQTGKSAGELGLVTTGAGMAGLTLRRVGKAVMQTGRETMKVAETITPQIARIVGATRAGVARIIPTPSGDGANTLSRLAKQRGSIGEPGGKKPFAKMEGKQIVDEVKASVEPKVEKRELGFDIANNPVYKEFPFLEKYTDVLGDLKSSDIISDIGTQGLIVKPERLKGFVAKIEKPKAVDRVVDEYNLHNEAYNIWKEGKNKGLIPESIYVPKVDMPKGVDNGMILIEQVHGQSLHTKALIENAYKTRKDALPLTQAEKGVVSGLTDGEAKRFIMERYGISASDAFHVIELYGADHLGPYLYDRMRPAFKTDLSKTLEYLSKQIPGINHIDIHPGNIMVTNDGKIYIIDWGRARITNLPNITNP